MNSIQVLVRSAYRPQIVYDRAHLIEKQNALGAYVKRTAESTCSGNTAQQEQIKPTNIDT